MRKFILSFIFFLCASSALAQNPMCPTRPLGDSTNACASTAFVQNTIGSGSIGTNHSILVGTGAIGFSSMGPCTRGGAPVYVPGATVDPTCSTAAGGMLAVGSLTANNIAFNFGTALVAGVGPQISAQRGGIGSLVSNTGENTWNLSNYFQNSDGGVLNTYTAINIDHHLNAGTDGASIGIVVKAYFDGTAVFGSTGGVIGISSQAKSTRGGYIFGSNPYAIATTVAAFQVIGEEINVSNQVNGSTTELGLQIIKDSNSTGTGTTNSSAIYLTNAVGAAGWATSAIQIGAGHNAQWPMASGSTLILTGPGTADKGIDFSASTLTTAAFKSVGFAVNGSGAISTGLAGTATGQISFVGTTSGTAVITAQAAAGSPTLTIGTTTGTIASSATSPLAISATTGVITCTTCLTTSSALNLVIGTTTIGSGTTTRILYDNAGVLGEYTITGTGTVVAMQTSPALITPAIGVATGTSLALGGGSIGSDALEVTGTTTHNGTTTVAGASFTLSGNISAAAWTTAGIRYKNVAGTLTDTTSSGTVATAYTNAYGGSTIAASSATTFTNYFNTYTIDPVQGTNVTFTNKWAIGADSAKFGTSNQLTISTTGVLTAIAPVLGTPTTIVLTNATGLPVSTGISGLGANVATALAVAVGSAGAIVVNGGVLGIPSSGTVTNLTGTASININGTVGATSQNTGQFTSLAYSTTLTGTSANASAVAVGRLGATTPAFQVDASIGSAITGLKITGRATTAGVDLTAIGETNVNLRIDAAGSGTIVLGGTSTGAITLTRATTLSAALTYGGVALSNAVTGTGNMVLSASPTFSGAPILAAPTATSWNGLIITTTAGTLTIANNASASLITSGNFGLTLTASATTNSTFPAGTDTLAGLGTGQTFTAQNIFNIARTFASATAAALDDIKVSAATTTITGNTGTPITKLVKVGIYQPTLTDSTAVTVSNAATLYVDAPPLAAGSVTLTRTWAILSSTGNVGHTPAAVPTASVVGVTTGAGVWIGGSGTGDGMVQISDQTNAGRFELASNASTQFFYYSGTLQFWNGSTTQASIVNSTGVFNVAGTTDASSATTGIATITGGLGVAKSAWIGTYVNVGTKIRAAGTVPALTSCGTGSPTISGSDLAGEVVLGTAATGCIITFNVAYAATPYCTVTWQTTPGLVQTYTVSTTAITLAQTSASGDKVNYTCMARSGGFLLKRDLDPAANDNTPMFLNKAA